jgi:hypothetical protein
VKTFDKHPDIRASDPLERRMAEALIFLREQKRKARNG